MTIQIFRSRLAGIHRDDAPQLGGFSFFSDGTATPALPENDNVDEMFVQLQQATSVEGKALWISALFNIKRDGMRFGADFQCDNSMRSKANPARMAAADVPV